MTTTVITTTTQRRVTINIGLLKSVVGWIKIAEIVFGVLVIVMCISSPVDSFGMRAWTLFVGISGVVLTALLFAALLFGIFERFARLPWHCVETLFNALYCLFYFVAFICMCFVAHRFRRYDVGPPIAAAFFAFICFVLYGCDGYTKFSSWRNNGTFAGSSAPVVDHQHHRTTVTTTRTVVTSSRQAAYP